MTAVDNEKIKELNEKKKEYLRGYRKHGRKIKRIEAELEEIRLMKMNPSMNNDGMPHGSSQSDLSKYASELDELENELYKEGVEQLKMYKDIKSRINELIDEDEREVMFYRYIKGLEFWEIAKNVGYSERHVKRLHGKALEKIKDVTPCHS